MIRPRTLLYFTLWAGIGVAMLVTLFMRDTLDVTVERDRSPVFVTLSDGSIRNDYTLKVQNKLGEPQEIWIFLDGALWMDMEIQGERIPKVTVPADSQRAFRVFITGDRGAAQSERTPIKFVLENAETHERAFYDSVFIAPEPGG